jgi:hypothetical protein
MTTSFAHAVGLAAALGVVAASAVAQEPAAAGLRAISALAELNGQALACQDSAAARRAKALMLAHAPKTPRYGATFEEGTQQSYLATTRQGAPCPTADALAERLDVLQAQLQVALPVAAK